MKKVSVVILNWNRKDSVLDCLEELKQLTYPLYEIIVVDNASTDGSAEAVRKAFSHVVVIENDQNYGAPEGKNVGLRRALESEIDYVFMLDNDIVADPECLTELVRVAESDPKVGLVGTIMYDHSKPDIILSAGGIIDFTQNVSRGRGVKEKDTGQFNRIEEVDLLLGGALLASKEVLERVGLFDSGYKGYWFEDTDLSVRVKRAGYKVLFNPFAKVWHKPHRSEDLSYHKKYLATRNAIRFMKKYATPANWIKYTFFVFAGIPFMIVRDLIHYRSMMGAVGKLHGFFAGLLQRADPA